MSNNLRLTPTLEFVRHYTILFYNRKPIVISAIKELQHGSPTIIESPNGNVERAIIHNNCILLFDNDALLEFDFLN